MEGKNRQDFLIKAAQTLLAYGMLDGWLQARTAGEGAADADLPAICGTVVGAVQAAQATAHDEDDLQKSAGQPAWGHPAA